MRVYPGMEEDGALIVRARMESEDGEIVGDMQHVVKPGETWAGLSYDDWRARAQAFESVDIEI